MILTPPAAVGLFLRKKPERAVTGRPKTTSHDGPTLRVSLRSFTAGTVSFDDSGGVAAANIPLVVRLREIEQRPNLFPRGFRLFGCHRSIQRSKDNALM
jgi:hypothetical protein